MQPRIQACNSASVSLVKTPTPNPSSRCNPASYGCEPTTAHDLFTTYTHPLRLSNTHTLSVSYLLALCGACSFACIILRQRRHSLSRSHTPTLTPPHIPSYTHLTTRTPLHIQLRPKSVHSPSLKAFKLNSTPFKKMPLYF